MNHIESVVRIQKTTWASREFKVVTLFDDSTKERFRKAALAYYRACEMYPAKNRCDIALMVASIHFEQDIKALQSEKRNGRLANIRQQLMAFSRVVSLGAATPNSLPGIGRCFKRDHSTVIYAVKKYSRAISEALECRS